MNINVNCHSSIKIGNIYVDPFKIKEESSDAKYIFITHSHFDHYSLEDVKKIIEDHGGYVWATSKEHEGTCIHFVIRKYTENKEEVII